MKSANFSNLSDSVRSSKGGRTNVPGKTIHFMRNLTKLRLFICNTLNKVFNTLNPVIFGIAGIVECK